MWDNPGMPESLHVATEPEREKLGALLAHVFGFPSEDSAPWFERAAHENLRVLREGGALAGGLIVVPMGQHFGGEAIPMTGVAGVGIAPEHRGRGTGTRLMRALMRELHSNRVPLTTLYPATVPLYQRAGYERAGQRFSIHVHPRDLPSGHDPALRVVALESVGDGPSRALHERFARARNGSLARGPYIWQRINHPHKGEVRFHGLEGPDGLEGYVGIIHTISGHDSEVAVTDLVAVTPRAVHAALALLGTYRSLAREVTWHGAPHDSFVQALRDRRHTIEVTDLWMLRVTHVEAALALRGYPAPLRGQLPLHVMDDVLPENAGAYLLELMEGAARVTRAPAAGGGGLTLDVRALATLYSGLRTATALAADGLIRGDAGALALADLAFSGGPPAMSEKF